MCCSNDCIENGCCSLETKALFFSIWTIVHGALYVLLSIIYLAFPSLYAWYGSVILLILSLVHLCAGIFLLIGYWHNKGCLFMSGIIMSSIIPYLALLSIYLPIVQIIFTLTSCMYYRKVMAKK